MEIKGFVVFVQLKKGGTRLIQVAWESSKSQEELYKLAYNAMQVDESEVDKHGHIISDNPAVLMSPGEIIDVLFRREGMVDIHYEG